MKGFYFDKNKGMINYHSFMTVLYIASKSDISKKLDHLFDIYFVNPLKNESDMILKDKGYYFILKAHLAVVNYSIICGCNKIKNEIQRNEHIKYREIKKQVHTLIESIYF